MTDYSYESDRPTCDCSREVALLQRKLTEVHAKLIAQIEVCREQEEHILILQQQARHGEIYDTFGRKTNNKENMGPNRRVDESREGVQLKNDLLQADLEAMRHRVLTEITEKNRLLEEMGDLKKRHRKEMALEVKKFEGLEILYRKLTAEKGIRPHDLRVEAEANRFSGELQELQAKLDCEKEKNRKANIENKQLRATIQELEREAIERRKLGQSREKKLNSEESSDQLREIDSLKQQLSRINKSISQREELKRDSSQRRRREAEPAQPMNMEMRLVGESRWGKRQYS